MSDHDHPHQHGHDSPPAEDRLQAALSGVKPPPPPMPDEQVEDAGSQALSDALRSSFAVIKFVMAGLLILFISSGVFVVNPGEKAVILRFGKALGEGENALRSEGIHWAWPYPIDEVERIPLSTSQTVRSSVGWYHTTAAMEAAGNEPPPNSSLTPGADGYTLTGDRNIIHVRATLRYRIHDPLKYIFNFKDTGASLVQNSLNNALFYASSKSRVDDALVRDITGFRELIENRVRKLSDEYNLGIVVESATIEAIPPRQLSAQFKAVSEAEQRRNQVFNEAAKVANEMRSEALARAEQIKTQASGDAERTIQLVAAEAQRFQDMLPKYRENPQLFSQRLQIEALQRTLVNGQDKILVPSRSDGKERELRINLTSEPPSPRGSAPEAKKDKH